MPATCLAQLWPPIHFCNKKWIDSDSKYSSKKILNTDYNSHLHSKTRNSKSCAYASKQTCVTILRSKTNCASREVSSRHYIETSIQSADAQADQHNAQHAQHLHERLEQAERQLHERDRALKAAEGANKDVLRQVTESD